MDAGVNLQTIVPGSVRAAVDDIASAEGRSRSQMLRVLITEALAARTVRGGRASAPPRRPPAEATTNPPDDKIPQQALPRADHPFEPSQLNALRCTCGQRKAGHP